LSKRGTLSILPIAPMHTSGDTITGFMYVPPIVPARGATGGKWWRRAIA